MRLTRRDLLKAATAAGLAMAWRAPLAASGPTTKRLILLELKGGNDGLNTFPKPGEPLYPKLRPTVALPDAAIRPLGSGRGINWALETLLPIWERGEFAIVDGVGSPKPDLSHFWAAQQWETGNPDDPTARTGWLAQAMATQGLPAVGATGAHAAVFGVNSGPVNGAGVKLLELGDISLIGEAAMPEDRAGMAVPEARRHLASVLAEWQHGQEVLTKAVTLPKPDYDYPAWAFSRQLQQLAKLMVQDPALRVFKVVLDGFDTHSAQVSPGELDQGRHYKLLRKLSISLAAFISVLRKQDMWRDTVIASYSEFGRRPQENGAGGTDHGTANSLFVLGGGVRGGFHGELPALDTLDANGNLLSAVDYRDYFGAVYQAAFKGTQGIYSSQPTGALKLS